MILVDTQAVRTPFPKRRCYAYTYSPLQLNNSHIDYTEWYKTFGPFFAARYSDNSVCLAVGHAQQPFLSI